MAKKPGMASLSPGELQTATGSQRHREAGEPAWTEAGTGLASEARMPGRAVPSQEKQSGPVAMAS